jgi:hypothetical protein
MGEVEVLLYGNIGRWAFLFVVGRQAVVNETMVPVAETASIRNRVPNALPLLGIGLALIMNAAWVALLGYYCILKLV